MKRYTKLLLLTILAALFFTACQSTENIHVSSISAEEKATLVEIEILLLEFKLEQRTSRLNSAGIKIESLLEREQVNKEFHAWLLALYSEWLYYSGDSRTAEKMLDDIESLNKFEQRIWVLKALLDSDGEAGKNMLITGSEDYLADRIFLDLGDAYFRDEEWDNAIVAYDKAFLKLDELYIALYQEKRDMAFSLYLTGAEDIDSEMVMKESVTISETVDYFQNRNNFMPIPVSSVLEEEELIELLVDNNLIPENADLSDDLTRSTLAQIVGTIIAIMENDPTLLSEIREQYATGRHDSPIGDVRLRDEWFEEILLSVEWGIMDLPDGENFRPRDKVTGEELTETVNRLEEWY